MNLLHCLHQTKWTSIMQKIWQTCFAFFIFFNSNLLLAAETNFNAQIEENLLANIVADANPLTKHDAKTTIHAIPGAVIASPSNHGKQFSQDYLFHWTRDAGITMHEILDLYIAGSASDKNKLRPYLINYVAFENKAQQQISRAHENTLGQPKFNLDGTIWEGQWGRPQNDGPAIRAITLIDLAKQFQREGNNIYLPALTQMINTDLQYIAAHWRDKSFDLWEEVNDRDHFFTKAVQRKALIMGAAFLEQSNETKHYLQIAKAIEKSMLQHWNQSVGYYSETIHQQYFKGGGLNSSILLGVLYGNLNQANDIFALNNDKVMSSVYFIRAAFASLYKVNLEHQKNAFLLGRYPNDIYDGNAFIYGNPWLLITNALAEYYYRLAILYRTEQRIVVTQNNLLFFNQLQSHLVSKNGIIYSTDAKKFNAVIDALIREGDNILTKVQSYATCYSTNSCAHFAEQLDRASGKQVSAKDLTWGYATFLSALATQREAKKTL